MRAHYWCQPPAGNERAKRFPGRPTELVAMECLDLRSEGNGGRTVRELCVPPGLVLPEGDSVKPSLRSKAEWEQLPAWTP